MPYDTKPLYPFDPASAAVDIEGCEDDVDVLSTSNTFTPGGITTAFDLPCQCFYLCDAFFWQYLHQLLCHDAFSILISATILLLLLSFSVSLFSRILKGPHLCNQDQSLFTWHILLNIYYPIMLTSCLFIMYHQHHFPAGLYVPQDYAL